MGGGGIVDSFSSAECVCKEVKLVSALGADELDTFEADPGAELSQNNRLSCLLTESFCAVASSLSFSSKISVPC